MAQQPVAPVRSTERLKSLDTLRGFALLGILVPNIVAFGWPSAAYKDISILGDAPMNQIGYAITSTVFLTKFMFLFAMLFGAGVIVYAHKYENGDQPVKLSKGAGLWYRRCAILLAFGLIHAYLFWFGDILTWYAVAGLTLLWWVRQLPVLWQLLLAGGCYLLGTALFLGLMMLVGMAIDSGMMTEAQAAGMDPAHETTAYLGSWFSAFKVRAMTAIGFHLVMLPLFLPSLWGIMMLGMALTRTGILAGARSMKFYLITGIIGIILGSTLTVILFARFGTAGHEDLAYIWQVAAQPVGVPLALGYAMLVIAATKSNAFNFITTPLAAVGRMALTNYFLHTLLCTSLFYGYGWGLGYFGKIQYPGLWYVIGSVWVVNIVFSLLWLKVFRFGPVEWAWRCMAYGKLLPILHTRSTPGPAHPQG